MELGGCNETQSSGRQQRHQSVCWLYSLSSSSSGSSSSGLLRLPPRHLTELKHTCTLGVFRSCSKYACILMFCKLRETTSCHIFTSLPCLSLPFSLLSLSFYVVFSVYLCVCLFFCVFLLLPCDCLKQLSALTQRLFSTASLPHCLSLRQPHQFQSTD